MQIGILSEPMHAVTAVGTTASTTWKALVAGECRYSSPGVHDSKWPDLGLVAMLDGGGTTSDSRRTETALVAAATDLGDQLRPVLAARAAFNDGLVLLATSHGDPEAATAFAEAKIAGDEVGMASARVRIAGMALEEQVLSALAIDVPIRTISAACASSSVAAALAHALIAKGRYGWVLIISFDLLARVAYTGFHRVGALSKSIARPFDVSRDGINIGEAVVGFVVADLDIWPLLPSGTGRLLGAGLCNDNGHMVEPKVEGVATALGRSLTSAGLTADSIDAVYWHGTGTQHNDRVEAESAQIVFRDKSPPSTSTKSIVGHCMGASGAINIVAALRTLNTGYLPGTVGLCDSAFPTLNVISSTRQLRSCERILVNALGFGGINASLVLGMAKT